MGTYHYDLIVVGNTPEARYGAYLAAQQQARVALITQGQRFKGSVLRSHSAQHQTQNFGRFDPVHPSIMAAQEHLSPHTLAIAGVDEVTTSGRFEQQSLEQESQWFWRDRSHFLQADHYLLAMGRYVQPPPLATQLANLTTLDGLLDQTWDNLPATIVILGGTPTALITAQSLQRLGKAVTLVCRDRLLPQEDPVVVQHLQAGLEAEGITIYTRVAVRDIEQHADQQVLQLERFPTDLQTLACDRIIWATESRPEIGVWNVSESSPRDRLPVNQYLRVHPHTQPQIYACGSLLGGYDHPNIGRYEAAIAVHNCLHRRQKRADYRAVPWVLATEPPLARVGLTPQQAKRVYGETIQVRTTYPAHTPHACLTHNATGLCQVVMDEQGRILGATLLGSGAEGLISAIALAIEQGLRWNQIPTHLWTALTMTEVLRT